MKFSKVLTVNIGEAGFDKAYWSKIDEICEKRVSLPKESPQIPKEISDADALFIGFGVKVDRDLIDKAKKLRYIASYGTSYGTIDVGHASTKGIVVTNVPGYSTESVAEFVFGCVIESFREIERAKSEARKGVYSEAGFGATEIKGKVFGVIGLGRIGRRVAELARSFGADVRYWSRNRKMDVEAKGVRYEELDKLISESDILSIHLALTKETENFMNEQRLDRVKKGALLINTAPMEIVSVPALERRLKKEDLTFILDHSDEMREEDLKLLSKYKNCVIYPPIGYISKEARVEKQRIFVDNIEAFLKNKPQNTV